MIDFSPVCLGIMAAAGPTTQINYWSGLHFDVRRGARPETPHLVVHRQFSSAQTTDQHLI
jgi:hypothetical protein